MVKLEGFDTNDFQQLINWVDTEEFLVQFGGPVFSFPLTIDQLDEYISGITCYEKNGYRSNTDKVNRVEVNGNSWTALHMTVLRSAWLKLL
jgi:hypothetical protein